MPPKRRRAVDDDEETSTPVQNFRSQRPVDYDEDDEESQQGSDGGSLAQLSKNLVRYALACEYARIPIKRQDVNQKVLGDYKGQFKLIFDTAQGTLLDTFGMELHELPLREKITIREKRAAATTTTTSSTSAAKSSNQWVLRTALPPAYRTSAAIGPSQVPTAWTEETYTALYTTIVSLISLSGGTLSEGRLDRSLKRLALDQSSPIDATDKLLARMQKDGYIVKVKDSSNNEEIIDWVVGPRGKVEVGKESVASMVRTVFTVGPQVEGLERKLNRSLGLGRGAGAGAGAGEGSNGGSGGANGAGTQQNGAPAVQEQRRRGRPRRAREDDDDE